MICDYCKQEYEHLNKLIVPYVFNANEHIIKTTTLSLCNKCFNEIHNKYEKYLTPYSEGALLALTILYEDLLFKEASK